MLQMPHSASATRRDGKPRLLPRGELKRASWAPATPAPSMASIDDGCVPTDACGRRRALRGPYIRFVRGGVQEDMSDEHEARCSSSWRLRPSLARTWWWPLSEPSQSPTMLQQPLPPRRSIRPRAWRLEMLHLQPSRREEQQQQQPSPPQQQQRQPLRHRRLRRQRRQTTTSPTRSLVGRSC